MTANVQHVFLAQLSEGLWTRLLKLAKACWKEKALGTRSAILITWKSVLQRWPGSYQAVYQQYIVGPEQRVGVAIAGTEMALSKQAASTIAGAAISVMNQSNEAANNGEPLTISPVKIVTDIATDNLADHIADKAPEIHFNNTEVSNNVNEGVKAATGDMVSKGIDMGVEFSKQAKPALAVLPSGVQVTIMPKAPPPDATSSPHPPIIQPVFKNQ